MSKDYQAFLAGKLQKDFGVGITEAFEPHGSLFDFQKHIVKWAVKKGRCAILSDCGTGKSFMQLEWANQVAKHTGGQVLILTPLAVGPQTVREAERFGIPAGMCASKYEAWNPICVTNYQKLHKFDPKDFSGIV